MSKILKLRLKRQYRVKAHSLHDWTLLQSPTPTHGPWTTARYGSEGTLTPQELPAWAGATSIRWALLLNQKSWAPFARPKSKIKNKSISQNPKQKFVWLFNRLIYIPNYKNFYQVCIPNYNLFKIWKIRLRKKLLWGTIIKDQNESSHIINDRVCQSKVLNYSKYLFIYRILKRLWISSQTCSSVMHMSYKSRIGKKITKYQEPMK